MEMNKALHARDDSDGLNAKNKEGEKWIHCREWQLCYKKRKKTTHEEYTSETRQIYYETQEAES